MWGDIAIAFILAFITAFVMTPNTIKLSKKVGAIDVPKDNRRMHTKPIPKLGGLAVLVGFLVSVIYLLIIMSIEGSINLFTEENYILKLLGFFIGILVISLVGFIDDVKNIKPLQKLAGQVIAAIIIFIFGIRIDTFTIPFFNDMLNTIFSCILTVCWIVGITNAINLIDGLDGLSSGISIISCISMLIIFALNDSPLVAIIIITALTGALLGFIPFNFSPAKTFIGDMGSNFLGFTLAVVSILGVAKTYTAFVIITPVIVLALPIFDTLFAIFRRVIQGKSLKAVFKADKKHLHHRIMDKGYTQKQAVFILYGISAAFGMFAIILLDSGIWKAISFALIVIAAIGLGYKNGFRVLDNEENDTKEQ